MPELQPDNIVWDLSALLKSDTDPEIETQKLVVQQANETFATTWKDRTDYLEDVHILLEVLTNYEALNHTYSTGGNPGFYFGLRSAVDQDNTLVKAGSNKMDEQEIELANLTQFFEHSLASISSAQQKIFLESPELAPFHHYLERLFAHAAHLLSEPEERIMNLKSQASYSNWVRLTSELLSGEQREVLLADGTRALKSLEEIASLTINTEKAVRDEAAAAFYDILGKHTKVAEAEINTLMADKKINDELRHYSRPDASRHLSDDISSEVVDAMIAAVSSRFDISQRFYALKAQLLGQKTLPYHERLLPYGSDVKEFSYPEALKLVHTTFSKIDSQFADILAEFTQKGQIDVYPKQGKRGGAFCATHLLSQPTYVFLNYTSKPRDVTTLAHEMGHAINSELMREKQNSLNFDTPLSTAEVASTFMEDFVLRELGQEVDEAGRLSLLIANLDDQVATVFRQVAGYQFEQEFHTTFREKSFLPASELGEIFTRHMSEYLGEAVEMTPGSENFWVYWPHIRRFFYVYSYASGLLISKTLQAKVHADAGFITQVKEFLGAGTSATPVELFARMGIDITNPEFWKSGVEEIDTQLKEAETLAKKLGKI